MDSAFSFHRRKLKIPAFSRFYLDLARQSRQYLNFMKCPYCGLDNSEVIETRDCDDLETIRRRRQCQGCEKRYTTYERIENIELIVIKKDGTREQFDREKLKRGLIKACEKTKISLAQIENLIKDIEKELLSGKTIEVESKKVGSMTAARLKKLDKVAYIRFASVLKEFIDLEDFHQEVEKLLKK